MILSLHYRYRYLHDDIITLICSSEALPDITSSLQEVIIWKSFCMKNVDLPRILLANNKFLVPVGRYLLSLETFLLVWEPLVLVVCINLLTDWINIVFFFCDKLRNTSLAAKGALAHRLHCRTACNTSPPALFKMAEGSGNKSNPVLLNPLNDFC